MVNAVHTVGLVGCVNVSLLAIICLWRWTRFTLQSYPSIPNSGKRILLKKHLFFFLLFFAAACDIPMFISFITLDDYSLVTYSFHKFEPAAQLGAFSLTIHDWTKVLFAIHEDTPFESSLRTYFLIAVNLILFVITCVNFATCYTADSLDDYTGSLIYIIGLFVQICSPFVLAIVMLRTGLKLYRRIKGASGASDPSRRFNSKESEGEFDAALLRLIVVMGVCALCLSIQIVLLVLNYAFGMEYSKDEFVVNIYFYWTFYSWLPLWAITISLLYLSRTHPGGGEKSVTRNDNSLSVKNPDIVVGFDSQPLLKNAHMVTSDYEDQATVDHPYYRTPSPADKLRSGETAGYNEYRNPQTPDTDLVTYTVPDGGATDEESYFMESSMQSRMTSQDSNYPSDVYIHELTMAAANAAAAANANMFDMSLSDAQSMRYNDSVRFNAQQPAGPASRIRNSLQRK